MIFQQIDDGGEIQEALWQFLVLGDPTSSAGPKCQTIGQGWAKLITEVVPTQGEMIGQPIIVREVGTNVVTERTGPIGDVKAIHFPMIPLSVDGLPVMLDIFGIIEVELLGSDGSSLAIRLRVACGNAN